MQVGYPEAGEFLGIAFALFPSPVQVAFQQASPAVERVDIRMLRPVHCPGGLRGVLQDGIVDHACSPKAGSIRANSKALQKVSYFSRFW
jgi:hypothetical protein